MQTFISPRISQPEPSASNEAQLRKAKGPLSPNQIGGAERDRTADPLLAKQVLSQLSYSPNRFDHLLQASHL